MYKGVEPKLEDGQLIIGDISVLWIILTTYGLTPSFLLGKFLAKDTPAGISAGGKFFLTCRIFQ
ncbi:MAG: hypothetical protein Ct9H300mP28_36970 [Pseudomonadota bacterium]|nr:MAG: hypothetical protein Ct9H300mP28_36970 [Pseudomonadota bacterium]